MSVASTDPDVDPEQQRENLRPVSREIEIVARPKFRPNRPNPNPTTRAVRIELFTARVLCRVAKRVLEYTAG